MIPRADIITVTPVGRIAPAAPTEAAGDARQQEFQRSLAGLVGKSMQAEVLSRLTDGSFLVKVAGTSARMMLPSNPQPGAELPLTLVAATPRPTFRITTSPQSAPIPAFFHAQPDVGAEPALYAPAAGAARQLPGQAAASMQRAAGLEQAPLPSTAQLPGTQPGQRAQPGAGGTALRASSYAATLLSKAPLTPADQLPPLDADSPPAALSQAARMITSVLSAAMQSPQSSTTVVGKTPLLVAPGIEPAKLAASLQEALGASGLFYESHLGEWSAGTRPLATLLREPQMQGALAPAPARAGQADAAMADPATAQFISQQLSTQELGRVAWQGQLWPGQDLRWEISRDRPGGGARQEHGEPAEPPWRSGMRLRFPLLGEIGATLVLAGDQLHIEVEAGASEVRDQLRRHAAALESALAAAGAPLASLTVRTGAARDD